jgi:RNA-directed DNA polymerase
VSISKYEFVERIGSGGFATVWKARPKISRAQRFVAVKIWNEPVDARRYELFEREFSALDSVDHPNVVRVREGGIEEDGRAYIVMEYVDGLSLDRSPPTALDELIKALAGAAQGLQALHDADVLHRDIKPANLLRGADGIVKIGDLGIASLGESLGGGTGGRTTQVIGTPGFVAPELLRGLAASPRSDIYALGATLFVLLSGAQPPVGRSVTDEVLAGMVRHSHLGPTPSRVTELMLKCLADDPQDRPRSADQFMVELEEAGSVEQLGRPPAEFSRRTGVGKHVTGPADRGGGDFLPGAETVQSGLTTDDELVPAGTQLAPNGDLSFLRDVADVAEALGVDSSHLMIVLWGSGPSAYYREFSIRKKNGELRTIASPIPVMRALQDATVELLEPFVTPKGSAHGYRKGRSILTNAEHHVGKRYVLNIDLLDFFPSINFGRVRGVLMAPPFNCGPGAATALAQICCLGNQLPIGAPTSPLLSNMVCLRLDAQLQRLAVRRGCWYTRYSDDITFSTDRERFPATLARVSNGRTTVGPELRRIVRANGFSINGSKSRLQSSFGHQEVTGITVNEFPNVNRRFVRNLRAMLHSLEVDGPVGAQFKMEERIGGRDRYPGARPSFHSVLRGRLAYLSMVRGSDDPLVMKLLERYQELQARG